MEGSTLMPHEDPAILAPEDHVDLNASEDPEFPTIGAPIQPTTRCKRCNCWLRSERSSGMGEDHMPREYCSACEEAMLYPPKTCLACGDLFLPDSEHALRCETCESHFLSNKRTCTSCSGDFLPYICMACGDKAQTHHLCHACHWRDVHAEKAALYEKTCRVCGCSFLPRFCIVPECGAKLTEICSMCHEELDHDGMIATVWELPDCKRCHKAISALRRLRRKINRKDMKKLSSGAEPDIDAMAHLAMSGGQAPLVFMDGRFLEPEEIEQLIASEGDA